MPVDYVNDPRVIAREDCFVSINASCEVDLVGQCARALIRVAHPRFRDELAVAARRLGYL